MQTKLGGSKVRGEEAAHIEIQVKQDHSLAGLTVLYTCKTLGTPQEAVQSYQTCKYMDILGIDMR